MPARRRLARRPRRAPRRNPMMRKGKKGGKLAVPRAMRAAPDQYAKVIESFQIRDSFANQIYTRNFNLNEFDRARAIAVNYKWYKAAKVTWTYTPLYNTFQDSAGATVSKPQIYFSMNRTQDASAITQGSILAQGSRPQQFTSNKTISYVPNWCSPGLLVKKVNTASGDLTEIVQCGVKAQTDWLVSPYESREDTIIPQQLNLAPPFSAGGFTNVVNTADLVTFNGHDDYIYQENAEAPVYTLVCTVTWLFKQPLFKPLFTEPEKAPVTTA